MTISEIENLLLTAAKNYYNGQESMSDEEYDALIAELRRLDPKNPLCANGLAASDSNGDEVKVSHDLTTGTLSKCANIEELKSWASRQPSQNYRLELKIDGSSMELRYLNGKFVKAITRGNGFEGLDRTDTLNLMNFPKTVDNDFTGSIRAEMVIYNSDFKANFSDNANPRNAVAGVINRKFSTLTSSQKKDLQYIHAIAYDVKGIEFSTQTELDQWLSANGFETTPNWFATSEDLIGTADKIRENLREKIADGTIPYNCDGVVIKADIIDREDRQLKTPKRDVALKPELETAVSKIVNIEWEMSGSFLNPIAVIEPVQLEGTTVTRANLSNLNKMMTMGVEIGKMAVISKHGQIIPQIDKILG